MIKKVKNTVPWTYFISDLKDKKIVETFCEKELQKTNLKEFRVEKVIKRKDDKVYLKWRGYDSSFNCWIDKKRHSINEWFFPEQKSLRRRVKFELDLSN